MTMFTAIRSFFLSRCWIIGIALCLLSACSTLRLGYDRGPTLATWWLDSYLDLDGPQEAQLRPALERWFAWHRRTQLPLYAQQLAQWQARADGPVAGSEVCAWADQTRERLLEALDAGVPAAAALLPLVRPAQWDHLAQHLAEQLAERREDFLQPRPEDRFDAALERAVDRAETLYGVLGDEQRSVLAKSTAMSPFDPARWLAERERRQSALVQSLRQLHADAAADAGQRSDALRALLRRYQAPTDADYAAAQARWQAHACETAAQLHNSSSGPQRVHLRTRLAGWEEDLRALAAPTGAP